MASEPRKIKGPCFDCNDRGDDQWEGCPCHRKRGDKTHLTPKLDPDELRPNVPPRMMS